MKTTKYLFLLFFGLITITSFAQKTISGITLPATQTIKETKLSLNGGGLREKLWIDLYVAGLYVQTKTKDAKTIVTSDAPMNIHIEIISSLITREKFLEAVNEGFTNSTNGNTTKISKEVATFVAAFKDPFAIGDKIDIAYFPNTGVVVLKNNKQIANIKGMEFKKALFGIWFGEKPADKNLMKGMLGL
jgi:hypothetical protein